MGTKSCLLALGLLLSVSAAPATGGDREFHDIVARLSVAYQKKPMPFMGFASFAARFAEPEGVSGLRLAIFEDVNSTRDLDGAGFDAFVRDVAGTEYRPMVRIKSNRDHEQTYIYVREAKGGYEMLMLNLESSEAMVIKMHLNPKAMEAWIDEPVDHGKDWAHRRLFDE